MRASPLRSTIAVSHDPQDGGGRDSGAQENNRAAVSPRPRPPVAPRWEEPPAWGTAAQISEARAILDSLITSRRGKVANSLVSRLAELVHRLVGEQASDIQILAAVRQHCELQWRRPVISEFVLRRLFDRDLFAAWKCLDLLRYDRTPHDVGEGFLRAVGSVRSAEGVPTDTLARDIFWQHFRPLSPSQSGLKPSGKVVLIAPGLGETGRNFYDQIAQLNRLGHEVYVMDQQWAGQTRNVDGECTPGRLDRGFGVARDVARMAEFVHRQLLPHQRLVLLGQGSGGAAILMMLVAQASGRLSTSLPKNLDAVLQAPYLAPTPNSFNKFLGLLARLPMGRTMSAASLLPRPTSDTEAAKKFAQCCRRDSVQVLLGSLTLLREDLQTTWDLLARGHKPAGKIAILHSADDPWADPAASHRLGRDEILGPNAAVRILSGAHHALGHVASERQEALWGLQKLGVVTSAASAESRVH